MGETSIDDQSTLGALKSPPSQMLPLVLCVKRSRDRFRLSRAVMSELGGLLKGHCIEFKYYADGIHSGLTPPG